MKTTLGIIALSWLAGCGSPTHLQYDHGRASRAAYQTQADLSRASVSESHGLSGQAGLEIRTRVFEQSTDSESGKAEYVQVIGVE
jgi:hypothetical protein